MGRKTFESIGRPLKDRLNIILSQRGGNDSKDVIWAKNLESALFFADHFSIRLGRSQFFVIGGQEVYKLFSEKNLFNKIYLTEIFASDIDGDAYFAENFDGRQWKTFEEVEVPISVDDEYPHRFSVLERRIKTVRQVALSEFMTADSQLQHYLKSESTLRQIASQEEKLKATLPLVTEDAELFE